mmetsp:Transcript_116096/g.375109  ORF Transcript_116096/g.375109 Transcript_116096/m.375109 type:complete len:278 (+) Transcript_116096:112-945(+)
MAANADGDLRSGLRAPMNTVKLTKEALSQLDDDEEDGPGALPGAPSGSFGAPQDVDWEAELNKKLELRKRDESFSSKSGAKPTFAEDTLDDTPVQARRGLRAPKPTMHFDDPRDVVPADPALKNLEECIRSAPLEGELGQLSTQLKREMLEAEERHASDDQAPRAPRSTVVMTSKGPLPPGVEDVIDVEEGQISFGKDGDMKQKLQRGATRMHEDGGTPDFCGHSRLTPILLESCGSRLATLTKEQIRSENDRLRSEVNGLREEIAHRRKELAHARA